MERTHHYPVSVQWTGNMGEGTKNYRAYERSYLIRVENKAAIQGSSDPGFRGDTTKHSPEELFVAAISGCHMLWYLHVCSDAGVNIMEYIDHASGTMVETSNGGGRFVEVTLHPSVTITAGSPADMAAALHHKANELCFIANSCNFPIHHKPLIFIDKAR